MDHCGYDENTAFSNREKLNYPADESRRLDLRILFQVRKRILFDSTNPSAPHKGLVLSSQEIEGFLGKCHFFSAEEQFDDLADEGTIQLLDILRQLDIGIAIQRPVALRNSIHLPLLHRSRIFHLTSFEEQCLIICLIPEPDLDLAKIREESHSRLRSFVTSLFARDRKLEKSLVPYLHGHYGTGKKSPAKVTCHNPGIPLLVADPGAMINNRFFHGRVFPAYRP